jgi:hypothetical protein
MHNEDSNSERTELADAQGKLLCLFICGSAAYAVGMIVLSIVFGA